MVFPILHLQKLTSCLYLLLPPTTPHPRSSTSVHTPPAFYRTSLINGPNRKICCSKSPNFFYKVMMDIHLVQSTLLIYRLRICINSALHRQIIKKIKIIEKLCINYHKLNVHVSLLIRQCKMRRCR